MEKQNLKEAKEASLFVYRALNSSGLDIKSDDLIWVLDEEQKQSAIIPLNLQGTSYFKINGDGIFLFDEENIEGKNINLSHEELGKIIRNAASKMTEDNDKEWTLQNKAEEMMECISGEEVNYSKIEEVLSNEEDLTFKNSLKDKNKEEIIEAITLYSTKLREESDFIGMEKFDFEGMTKTPDKQAPSSACLKATCKNAKEKLSCVNEMIETGKQVEEENERKTIFNCAKTVLTSRIKGWKEKLNEFGEKAKEVLIKHGGKIFLTSLLATQINVARAESFNDYEEVKTPYATEIAPEKETNKTKDTELDKLQIGISAMEENIERAKKSIEELEKDNEKINEKIEEMDEQVKDIKSITDPVEFYKKRKALLTKVEENKEKAEAYVKEEILVFGKRIEELKKEYLQEKNTLAAQYEGHDTITEVLFPNEAREESIYSAKLEKEEKDNAKMETRESITVDGTAKEIGENLGNLANSIKQEISLEQEIKR